MEFCKTSELVVSPYLLESKVEISFVTEVFIVLVGAALLPLLEQAASTNAAAAVITPEKIHFLRLNLLTLYLLFV
ncbi:hypothetical protein Lc367_0413 [Lactobacillus crispatus EM-LC1]|nr:hypothetical protein Lc367_0413 [Lactobacillus crispatus EM-LC1]